MPGLKQHLIGLCGFGGVGKDTVADLLVTHAGFRKFAFAEPLKAELAEAFHAEPLLFNRPEFKTQPMAELAWGRCTDANFVNAALRVAHERTPGTGNSEELARPRTPRETMQLWGTEYRRAQDPNYWTRALVSRVLYSCDTLRERNLIVTDVRFPNEVDALRGMGALLWQVRRPSVAAGGSHTSTTDGTEFGPDAVIANLHDIKHLQQVVLGEFWALDAGLDKVEVRIP